MSSAFNEVRNSKNPVFIEVETYRWREHCGPNYDDDLGYRGEEEVKHWKENDILKKFQEFLLNGAIISQADVTEMEQKINQQIDIAFQFAEGSPFPEPGALFTDVYSTLDNGSIPWCDD